jgi:DNA repair photolyase
LQAFPSYPARTILTPVSGFLREAGFTHSLSPARNCTFACSYCYVPTMRVQAGLRPEDWRHWGESTTFKENAAELLRRELRPHQVVYCSPLTDPYQPAESQGCLMPAILRATIDQPPACFVIQTRGPLILRDLALLTKIPNLRVGFSITTDREDVRRVFESRCAPLDARWETIARLREAGIAVSATLAPLLPCDPEALVHRALDATDGPVIADPLHVRAVKRSGATTRDPALALCARYGWQAWLDPQFQVEVLARMDAMCRSAGRSFGHGPAGFGLLAKPAPQTHGNIPGGPGVI